MFSDRFRLLKIIMLSTFLFGLCLHCYLEVPSFFRKISGGDNFFDTKRKDFIKIGFADVIKVQEEGNILIAYKGKKIEVKIKPMPIKIGEKISVEGYFLNNGILQAKAVTIHKYRWLKKVVSAVAAVLVVFLVLFNYRISIKERAVVERGTCRI